MITLFPDIVKKDLYSCLLYIFAKVYESKKVFLISVILPYLKQVVTDSQRLGTNFVEPFYQIVSKFYTIDAAENYTILTTVILVTCGAIKLDEEQSKRLSSGLLQLLLSDKTASLSLQCIKSLLQQNGVHVDFILKNLITDLVGVATGIDPVVDISTKLSFEILILYTKNVVDNKQKLEAIYSLLLPLLIKRGTDDKLYTRDKLLHLIRQDALVFKEVVNKCNKSE